MKTLFRILIVIKLTVFIFVTNTVYADVPGEQVVEVNHLLDFVKNSGCTINRNGTDHPAEKGVGHIEKKYDYFRDDISNTEEFIEYSATRSTMSGDYYTVSCPNKKTIRTQDWLMAELKRFRSDMK